MYGGSAPESEQHKMEVSERRDKGSRSQTDTRGLYTRRTSKASSHEQEVGVVALLLLPHTLSRTLWPVHEARGAALHMLGEVLWRLVQFAIAASTEECDP